MSDDITRAHLAKGHRRCEVCDVWLTPAECYVAEDQHEERYTVCRSCGIAGQAVEP